jgi:peroxiredoxin
MKWKAIKSASYYVLVVAGFTFLGTWSGSLYGGYKTRQAEGKWQETIRSTLQERLRADIGIGLPFPEFWLHTAEDSEEVCLWEVMPYGGVIVYLSATCPGRFLTLKSLLDRKAEIEHSVSPVVLIADGLPDSLMPYIRQHNLQLPVLFDAERRLPRDYGIVFQPTYFAIDSAGILRDLGTVDDFHVRIASVLDRWALVRD